MSELDPPSQPTATAPVTARPVVDDCWNRIGSHGDKSCPQLERHIRCLNCEVYHGAAAMLLDRPAPADYREAATRRIARRRVPKLAGTRSIVIFRIGAEWLALPTEVFVEILELRPVHSLPHRQDALVRGLTVVRGELLICISLPHLLGFEASAPAPESAGAAKHHGVYERLLVVGRDGSRVVFAVDEVHVGVRYHANDLKPVPSTVSQSASSYTLGLLSWEDRNVGVLDESLVFYTLGRQLA